MISVSLSGHFTRTISEQEIESIRNNPASQTDKNFLQVFWENFKDSICGTKKELANDLLGKAVR